MEVKRKKPDCMPMLIKNFRQVKLDSSGFEIVRDENDKWKRTNRCYGTGTPVFKYDLYFASSRHYYDTDYVRARDNRQAKRKIRHKHPEVIKFDFGDRYAD